MSEPYTLAFDLPGLPRTANGAHGHWQVKAAINRRWKQAVYTKAWPLKPREPLSQVRLTLTRHSSVEPDFDNLAFSFKNIIDGLRQAGIIVDDRRVNIGQPTYLWQYAPPRKGRISIRVEELTNANEEKEQTNGD